MSETRLPDMLALRKYRARYRDIRPGDNAGRIVRWAESWHEIERLDQLAELMSTPP